MQPIPNDRNYPLSWTAGHQPFGEGIGVAEIQEVALREPVLREYAENKRIAKSG